MGYMAVLLSMASQVNEKKKKNLRGSVLHLMHSSMSHSMYNHHVIQMEPSVNMLAVAL